HHASLRRPYRAKNAPRASIEELLMVKGVDQTLLFGGDLTRSGFVDPAAATANGPTDLGWSQFLTVYSRELNVNSKGTKLKDINATADGPYYDLIASNVDEDLAKYMVLYRKFGPQQETVSIVATFASVLTGGKSNSITLTMKSGSSSSNSSGKTVNGSLSSLSKEAVLNAQKSSGNSNSSGGGGGGSSSTSGGKSS